MAELINLAQNLDCYDFYPGVTDDEALGRIYVEEMEAIDVPEHLLDYFDYEAYGRDIRLNDDGHFAPGGYVQNNRSQFVEHYHGHRGHSRRAPGLFLSQADDPGADGRLSGNHRPLLP